MKLGEKGEGAERRQRGGSGGFENTFCACMKFLSNSILKKEAALWRGKTVIVCAELVL